MSLSFVLFSRFVSFRPAQFWLPEGVTTVGRSSSCDFYIPNPTVSRQHAEIHVAGTTATVRDLLSSNGTFVAGRRIRKSRLKCGMQLQFGHVGFLVDYADPENCELDSDQETARLGNREEAPGAKKTVVDIELLTPAQGRVFDMLLDGHSEKLVADMLYLTQQTVHTHIKEIYRVCDVHSRAELLSKFVVRDDDDR